ncbi:MAG: DUF1194 domain-containing protein [Paracoccaceae bacterium]
MDLNGKHWPLVIRALLASLLLWGSVAHSQTCRLALVLALDVSSSVNAEEDQLQRTGLAAALLTAEVQQAFFAAGQPVALHAFEWSGRYDQVLLLPNWTMIDSPQTLQQVAHAIATSPRSRYDMPTALGHAMGFAATLLQRAPPCTQHTIDVAGDGQNNDGFSAALAYGAFPFENVTVNALVVATGDSPPSELTAYFQTQVIRGPGAFLEVAQGFGDYENAMIRKLLRELAAQALSAADPAQPDLELHRIINIPG